MDRKTNFEIIELLEGQRSIMNKQVKIIERLVNENIEQENMINVLMTEFMQQS